MNNNFMGYFGPSHNSMGMSPDFGRGPPGQQGGFGGLPPNMNPHGGLNMPGFQHHQRLLHYENNHIMGPLSPGMSSLPPGSGIGPPSGRLMDMNFARLQHYRATQQSHLQHSPGSLSPMPGMSSGLPSQSPYGLRMPNLAPKQQMLEARLQSSLGNGITRWPRMPSGAGLTRPQMPQLLMNQGPMPMLQNTNEFQLGGSPTFSSADMMRYMKVDGDEIYSAPGMSMNSFDFPPPSHQFPSSQNPFSMDSQMSQPPPLKQSDGSQMPAMSPSPLSFGQPQSLGYGQPASKSFVDSYSKFMNQVPPHSPKLTHFGPSPNNDIFDQPSNPLTPLTSQEKSPFSPFGGGGSFNENLNSPVGMRNMPQSLPMQSSSPVIQTSSLNLRSPTKVNPLLTQIQQLKQHISQLEDNPMSQGSPDVSLLKQQLEHTYMQYISQQRSNDFPQMKDSNRVPQPHDFYLDKPPMTPRPQTDFSIDKPPPTPRPQPTINDFRMEKMPKAPVRGMPPNDFIMEKSLSQPHLQQDFLLKKSPQTPIAPPHHDIFDKPPMTPRPVPQHDFMMEKSQQHLSQSDFMIDKPPPNTRQKQQHGFVFGKPQLPMSQQQLPLSQTQLPLSRTNMQLSQSQLHLAQSNYFDKPPHTPRPQPMQQEPMLDKHPPISHPNAGADFVLDKMPPTPGSLPSNQTQTNFNMVKSPVRTQAPMQLPMQQQPQRPSHIPLQSPLRSPPAFFSQASQSPLSTISTPIHSVSQQQDTDIDLKDDIALLDELLQTKLNEPPDKQEPLNQTASRTNSMSRSTNPMPVLDGMPSSAASPTIPPTMPVLAPSVPPPSSIPKYENALHNPNQGMMQNVMPSMPMPFHMPMSAGPMPMGMPDNSMMFPGMFGLNFGMMPTGRPPHLKQPGIKERSKANKNSASKSSGLAPAPKKKKVRRKSSESDTIPASPKTPVTPATPNSTPGTTVINPSSNVSSVNSGESIAAVNPFTLDDNLADNAATRRSLRERKKKNYNDDYDYNISDDEEKKKAENGEPMSVDIPGGHKLIPYKPSDAVEGEIAIIERILAGRIRSNAKDEEGNDIEDEEFCVKYKGYSYLHCEWGTEKELSKKDKRAPMKIKRFKTKRDPVAILAELDDEPFNPDFVEVDRVLDQSTCMDQVTGEPVTHYLVKWRSLPYEDSTWELEVNVDEPKIKQYLELKKPPPPEFQQYVPRPQAFQWKKIETSPVYKDGNTLRDYQLEGLNWLTFCWYKRQNCILADEMGLGKTVQSISFLCELKRYGVRGPYLVIAPLSTIVHWQREFEAWSDINTIVYHGSSPSRLLIQQYEMSYTDEKGEKIPGIYKFEAVVTTYEMILSDNDMLSKIPWRCAVIDEAHRLKNRNCKLLEGLNKLQLEHRVLLTGTPLQNNVEELFSLLNFLEPTRFPSQAAFLVEFGKLETEAQVDRLQQILKPMMLRRLKDDVEKNVPPKEETIIEVELTTIQKKFYRAILEKNFAFLTRGLSTASNTPNLMNAMLELRKCCNHPFLINGAEERIVSEYTNGAEGVETITKHFKAMTESSGKMVLIDKLLPKLKAGGHKVLMFSQMIRVLDLIEDYLLCKKYSYERIDGRVRGTARQAAIDRFCRPESDRFVFLLCTRAGGVGINLTAADTVIIFDSDWNPQNDLQAQARCHRIGQSKPVKIYRLICRNTYERDMFDKASRKLALDRAVLQNMSYREHSPAPALPGNTIPGGASTANGAIPGSAASPGNPAQVQPQPMMSKKEIEDLLKRGAYGAIMDEDGDASTKFCEEDIDQILERRTQVIQIVGEGKGSTFAKASFVSNTAKMDIDVDDPEFWTKWAQKAAIDVKDIDKENLIIDKPRERKQTKRFGNEDGSLELSDAESVEDQEEEKPVVDAVRSAWSRVECFRVEKNMLIYGWGRWRDFLLYDNFKTQISERDLEAIGRTILVFCLHHFKGDEKVKIFISSLITKSVTRSRIIGHDIAMKEVVKDEPYTPDASDPSKQKKVPKLPKKGTQNSKPVLVEAGPDWKTVDTDTLVIDQGYRKHLAHHSKKILTRVKLLYCLRHEIIGGVADKILIGLPASDIPLQVPHVDGEAPTSWWDVEADKSLLIGVFKHGYDKYNSIRTDPCLCFVSKLMLSSSEVEKLSAVSPDHGISERHDDVGNLAPGKRKRKKRAHEDDDFNSDMDDVDRDDDESLSMIESPLSSASPNVPSDTAHSQNPRLKWPQAPDLNTRLRRLITGYLKGCEKEQMKLAQQEKDKERRERQAQQIREKQLKKAEMALRWSRREVTDFYRVVTTFGVIYDEETKTYDWSKFRKLAKLEKKDDERITAYYEEFSAMCRRVCEKSTPDDLETKRGENLEPISDERAHRVLHRVDLLLTIRNKVLTHENLDERISLCEPSNDFPVWWKAGVHDKELLVGVAKHGLGRTDSYLFSDETLCFKGILDSLALQLKKRKQEQLAQQSLTKIVDAGLKPADEKETSQPPVNSTVPGSETTSINETPSSGVIVDRQPIATHDPKPAVPEEKGEAQDESVSKEVAEIIAAWPKDKAMLGRLEKICQCVLNNAWPKNVRVEPSGRSHTQTGQTHPTLPGSFDRADLMRQPTVSVGGEDGPRGEMAKGLLSPEKNFKVTSLDGLKITVKKKRRRRTKEQMAAAAAAKAQLAQVPPPEHLKFPVSDIQAAGGAVLPNDKVKRRRKRKGDSADAMSKNLSSQSSSDEPPLKVVPHPVKYTPENDSAHTDLQMTLNPSIILHVPANMDQKVHRVPNSIANVPGDYSAAVAHSHNPEKTNVIPPTISHSIESLVHSNAHSSSGFSPSPRSSVVEHLPNTSRLSASETSSSATIAAASDTKAFRKPVIENSDFFMNAQKGIKALKPVAPSEFVDTKSKEQPKITSQSNVNRPVDHAAVISPNVNPFEKKHPSIGESNIFDMLPLHMQSSSGKDSMLYGNINSTYAAKAGKQKHSKDEPGTPPALSKYFEGHKASAAMAALAAKLHSQATSQGSRPKQEHHYPNIDSMSKFPVPNEEFPPRTSSAIGNIRSPPLESSKPNTISYRSSRPEDETKEYPKPDKPSNPKSSSNDGPETRKSSQEAVFQASGKVSPVDTNNRQRQGIAGHPHSMASLLSSQPVSKSPIPSAASPSMQIPNFHNTTEQRSYARDSQIPSQDSGNSMSKVLNTGRTASLRKQSSAEPPSKKHTHYFPNTNISSPVTLPDNVNTSTQKVSAPLPMSLSSPTTAPEQAKQAVSVPSEVPQSSPNATGAAGQVAMKFTPISAPSPIPGNVKGKPKSVVSQSQGKSTVSGSIPSCMSITDKVSQLRNKVSKGTKSFQGKSVIKKTSPGTVQQATMEESGASKRATSLQPDVNTSNDRTSNIMHSSSGSTLTSTPVNIPSPHTENLSKPSLDDMARSKKPNAMAELPVVTTKTDPLKKEHLVVSKNSSPAVQAKQLKPTHAVPIASQSPVIPSSFPRSETAATSQSHPSTHSKPIAISQPKKTTATITKIVPLTTQIKMTTSVPTARSVSISESSPLSVIKSSVSMLSSAASVSSTVPVITPLSGLIKVVDAANKRSILTSASKVRPTRVSHSASQLSSQTASQSASVITVAASSALKHTGSSSSTLLTGATTTSNVITPKPISLQIVTATSSIVACLAGATLSQVASIVKPSSEKQRTGNQTSVVSTILKVIPSVGRKADNRVEASSSNKPASINQRVPVSQPPQSLLKTPSSKTSASTVPFSTAIKVTVTSSTDRNKHEPSISLHSDSSLLKTVSAASSTGTENPPSKASNQKTVQPTKNRTSSERQSHKPQKASPVATSSSSEDTPDVGHNAPVASRTRPSTRRITTLSALGSGPVKKGVKGTPVTSPKGATTSAKSQATLPTGVKTTVVSTPATISGSVTTSSSKSSTESSPIASGSQKTSEGKHTASDEKRVDISSSKAVPVPSSDELKDSASQSASAKADHGYAAAAALAKFNESIVIQTTRTVTSVSDRPKTQKRSLASIVKDLASKSSAQHSVTQTLRQDPCKKEKETAKAKDPVSIKDSETAKDIENVKNAVTKKETVSVKDVVVAKDAVTAKNTVIAKDPPPCKDATPKKETVKVQPISQGKEVSSDKEAAKGPVKEPVKEPSKEPIKEPAKEPAKKICAIVKAPVKTKESKSPQIKDSQHGKEATPKKELPSIRNVEPKKDIVQKEEYVKGNKELLTVKANVGVKASDNVSEKSNVLPKTTKESTEATKDAAVTNTGAGNSARANLKQNDTDNKQAVRCSSESAATSQINLT